MGCLSVLPHSETVVKHTHVLHSCNGNVVFSSAILNPVDHSKKGMAGFDPDS